MAESFHSVALEQNAHSIRFKNYGLVVVDYSMQLLAVEFRIGRQLSIKIIVYMS